MCYQLGNPAWSRGVIVSPTVYLPIVVNYDLSYFFQLKEDPPNLESQNQAKNILVENRSSWVPNHTNIRRFISCIYRAENLRLMDIEINAYLLFFLKLNITCSPLVINLQIN